MAASPAMAEADFSFVDEMEALLPELRAFARSLCRRADLADDLVQSACLKAWASADTFDPKLPMRNWIMRILRNEYLQHVRKNGRLVDADPDDLANTLVAPDTLSPITDLQRVLRAVYALPLKQRDAIILVHAAGLTYEEAGDVLACSPGTVRSRVSRGKDTVRVDLDTCRLPPPQRGSSSQLSVHQLVESVQALLDTSR